MEYFLSVFAVLNIVSRNIVLFIIILLHGFFATIIVCPLSIGPTWSLHTTTWLGGYWLEIVSVTQ